MRKGLGVGVAGALAGLVITVAPPAWSQAAPPSPRVQELARDLAYTTAADSLMRQVLEATVQPLTFNLKAANPGREADIDSLFEKTLLPAFRTAMQPVLDSVARNYAARFTEAELKAMVDFYATPVGQKALNELPSLIRRTMVQAQGAMPQLLTPVMREFTAACQRQGLKLPSQ
ncbi:DUF2059 domain-containing protein [Azospirillum sp. B4]|uniref:DUF2059 domain-containing protein n=1 Tax=Azospirillum sp. B4 TaxID=95605 RepID=UPI00131ED505|nr:DUF2059 domain-containing protein [Azospirillum sp. B4]